MENVALSCEVKLLSVDTKDPVGLMFARIDKTFANLFFICIDMIHLEYDSCSVYNV